MPTLQPPLPLAQPHRNQGLFSDYYLNSILPGRPEWRGLAEEAGPVMEQIAALFAGYTPSANEAQVEHELIRPVLLALGHTFEVQAPLQTPEGTRRPDYVFYRDAAARAAHKDMTLTDERICRWAVVEPGRSASNADAGRPRARRGSSRCSTTMPSARA